MKVQENDGFNSLIGQTITIFCAVYIYTGKLVVNGVDFVKIENPKIVYETGPFTSSEWKDAQALPNDMYIQKGMIESFGVVK